MNEKAIELFGNEAFLEKISGMDDMEEIKNAFEAEGVTLDIDSLKAQAIDAVGAEELAENELENVSGGIIGAITLGWAIGRAIGVIGRTIYETKTGKPRTYSNSTLIKVLGL